MNNHDAHKFHYASSPVLQEEFVDPHLLINVVMQLDNHRHLFDSDTVAALNQNILV